VRKVLAASSRAGTFLSPSCDSNSYRMLVPLLRDAGGVVPSSCPRARPCLRPSLRAWNMQDAATLGAALPRRATLYFKVELVGWDGDGADL
jgi:hypothetical protein